MLRRDSGWQLEAEGLQVGRRRQPRRRKRSEVWEESRRSLDQDSPRWEGQRSGEPGDEEVLIPDGAFDRSWAAQILTENPVFF